MNQTYENAQQIYTTCFDYKCDLFFKQGKMGWNIITNTGIQQIKFQYRNILDKYNESEKGRLYEKQEKEQIQTKYNELEYLYFKQKQQLGSILIINSRMENIS
jgi:hypothetical protein